MSYIRIKNLTHRFSSGKTGISDINLVIEKGEFVIIAGKNGSGKTTFCRHLNGLLKPSSGSVTINQLSVSKNPIKARQKVGMVFQNADSQIIGETVAVDIAFGPENLGMKHKEIEERVHFALAATGLQDLADTSPQTLSGGEKRRLAIAGILAMQPEIIIFDEPFSNLDYPGSQQILKQILHLHEKGHTIILVTHELEKVIAHANRLVIFEEGSLVREGKPESILGDVEQYGIREPCSSKLGHGILSWLN
jgi:cobalt transport protein ATP-binding subunit